MGEPIIGTKLGTAGAGIVLGPPNPGAFIVDSPLGASTGLGPPSRPPRRPLLVTTVITRAPMTIMPSSISGLEVPRRQCLRYSFVNGLLKRFMSLHKLLENPSTTVTPKRLSTASTTVEPILRAVLAHSTDCCVLAIMLARSYWY